MTTTSLGRLLIVDDEIELQTVLCESLTQQGYETAGFASGEAALTALQEQNFDLLLTDLMMPGMDGIALLQAGLQLDPNLVGIIMTGQGTVQTAVEAMKVGAFDYVLKPFKLQAVLPVLARAMKVRQLRLENVQLRETVTIHELTQAIAYTLDLTTILNKVADAALQQLGADEASIMLPTPAGDQLHIVVVRGAGRDHIQGWHIPIDEGIAGWVARHQEPLVLEGEVKDERFAPARPRPEIAASVSMPMLVGGKLVGMVNVNAINRRRPFTLGEVKALSILVSTAAHAVESARLYEQTREAEQKYRAIFENAVGGIFQSTAEGRLMTANPALARMLGYESAEQLIAGVTDMARQLYVDPDGYAEFKRQLAERSEVRGAEAQVYRKDRSVMWISVNARAVHDAGGEKLYHEGVAVDITERKEAEAALREANEELENRVRKRTADLAGANEELQQAKDEADAANQAKSDFLSRMSHELRTPLNAILGFGQILEMQDLPPLESESTQHILKAGHHLLELINEVLDIARVEAGRMDLSTEPVALHEVIGESLDLIRPQAAQSDIHIEVALPPAVHVRADRQRLKQVLINLLSNAVKYNRLAGSVTISAAETAAGCMRLQVSDTGPGLTAEDLQKLFVPFERLQADTTGVEGTGLGLTLSKRLVEAMEGTLGAHSEPGRGSTFWLELPLAESPLERIQQLPKHELSADELAAPTRTFTVLSIEDNVSNHQLIEAILESRPGIKLEGAMQGSIGLELAQQHHPDLILLDVHLPDMMGWEVLRRLRESPETSDIPVVVISADATEPQRRRLLTPPEGHPGADAYLTKPLNVKEVLRLVDKTLKDREVRHV